MQMFNALRSDIKSLLTQQLYGTKSVRCPVVHTYVRGIYIMQYFVVMIKQVFWSSSVKTAIAAQITLKRKRCIIPEKALCCE